MRTNAQRMLVSTWRLAATTLAAAGVVGCGPGTPEVAVTLSEFSFEPGRISIPRSQKTALKLKNTGSVEHNLSVPQLNLSSVMVAPGRTETLEFALPRGGAPLKVVCTVPGHEEAGMVAELVAVERTR